MSSLDSDREQAVQLINDVKLATDTPGKVSALKGFWEVVVNKQPALIEEFVPEIALLQVDTNKAVRIFVAEYLEKASLQGARAQVLGTSLQACLTLLSDPTPAVVKRAILASNTVCRCAFWVLASAQSQEPANLGLVEMWGSVTALKSRICDIGVTHANDGVRLNAIKFMEQIVLLYTASSVFSPVSPNVAVQLSPSHPLLKPTVLAYEAQMVLSGLIGLLTVSSLETVSTSTVIVALKALTAIALERNQHMGRILPTLLALATDGSVGDGARHGSLRAELKKSLLILLRSQAPACQAWNGKVESALKGLGALDSEIKKAGRQGKRERIGDGLGNGSNGTNKRQKTDFKGLQESADGKSPDVKGEMAEQPAAEEVLKVIIQLGNLVKEADWDALHALLETLSTGVLVEVVMANMAYLPNRHDIMSVDTPSSSGALSGLMEGLRQEEEGEEEPMDEDVNQPPDQPIAGDAGVAPPLQGIFDDVKAELDLKEEDDLGDLEGPAPSPATGQALSADHILQLRKAAFTRILIGAHSASEAFRGPLLARLATEAPLGDGVGDAFLEHLLSNFGEHRGFELALKWLYSLFVSEASESREKQNEEATSAKTKQEPMEGVEGEEAVLSGEETQPSSTANPDHSATRYEAVLMALLEGMREQLPPSDKSMLTIILEAPALPLPSLFSFLRELCDEKGDWPTLALTTARSLIAVRPAARQDALEFILQSAISQDPDIRDKAVRLLANRLIGEAGLQNPIESFAKRQLLRITEPAPVDKAATMSSGGDEGASRSGGSVDRDAAEARERDGSGASTTNKEAMEEEALCWVELYTALCTKNHNLLRGLFEAFGKCRAGYKGAVLRNADKLALVLGPDAPALLDIVRDCPANAENLLLKMLYGLTEKAAPSTNLMNACLEAFDKKKDPRLLPPALGGMSRQQALSFMPSLLLLEPPGFKAALHRMLMPLPPSGEPLFTPSSVLMAIHSVDPAKEGLSDGVKRLMAALNVCMQQRDVFNADSLALVLNQLVQRTPLPQLFMWFVLHTLVAAPRLRPFIMELLSTLVAKQIWKNQQQWKGWLLCAQHGTPESFPAMLQLPPEVFAEGFPSLQNGDKLLKQLADYASSPNCPVPVSRSTMAALQAAIAKMGGGDVV